MYKFKDIPCLENYCVNKAGQVYSKKRNMIIKGSISDRGYLRVTIKRKTYRVHRLVAMTFLNKYKNMVRNEVNHKDGNKLNNCVDNLEWCSRKENNDHAIETGLWVVTEKMRMSGVINHKKNFKQYKTK